ncbi:MAG TPA: YqgE/AlgH family protein [Burkholderiales bacterium]|nr:YqgE/AlgH family protein [Burkholderiales bacterium]
MTPCILLSWVLAAAAGAPDVPAYTPQPRASGIFLVARREMRDPRFQRTVVLVTQTQGGAPWGVIINRPLKRRLSEVFTEHEALRERKDVVFYGGPVAPEGLVFLVRAPQPPPRAIPVLRDVYFTSDPGWIEARLKRSDPLPGLRVYAGYAGWAPGQLQNEIARGDWYVLPADPETVFETDSARIWPELEKRASTRYTREGEGAGARPWQISSFALPLSRALAF